MSPVDRGRFWTIPNMLSLSRPALLPVWWALMASSNRTLWWWAGGLILYGIVSDVLDGYIARRFDMRSEWGKILDPMGDKLAAGVVGIFCVVHRELPLAAFLLTVGRDLFLVIAGWIILKRGHVVPASLNVGRFAALVWGIALLVSAFDWQPYARYFVWPAVAFYLVAGIVYVIGRHRMISPDSSTTPAA